MACKKYEYRQGTYAGLPDKRSAKLSKINLRT